MSKTFHIVSVSIQCSLKYFCSFFQWFLGNVSYQEALDNTHAGIVNTLSSTSGLFTLLLAAVFPANNGDRLTLSKAVAVLMKLVEFLTVVLVSHCDISLMDDDSESFLLRFDSMGGVVLVCMADLSFEARVPTGAIWAVLGSFFYASYLVLLRRKVENEEKMDIAMFFGKLSVFKPGNIEPFTIFEIYRGLTVDCFFWLSL